MALLFECGERKTVGFVGIVERGQEGGVGLETPKNEGQKRNSLAGSRTQVTCV